MRCNGCNRFSTIVPQGCAAHVTVNADQDDATLSGEFVGECDHCGTVMLRGSVDGELGESIKPLDLAEIVKTLRAEHDLMWQSVPEDERSSFSLDAQDPTVDASEAEINENEGKFYKNGKPCRPRHVKGFVMNCDTVLSCGCSACRHRTPLSFSMQIALQDMTEE